MAKYFKAISNLKLISVVTLFALFSQLLLPVLLIDPVLTGSVFAGDTLPDDPMITYDIEGMKKDGSWSSSQICLPGEECYTEGDAVPFRLIITGLTPNTSQSLTIRRDYSEYSNYGYESILHPSVGLSDVGASGVSFSESTNQPCGGFSFCRDSHISFQATDTDVTIYFDAVLGLDASDWTESYLEMKIFDVGGADVSADVTYLQVDQIKKLPSLSITKEIEGPYQDATPSEWCFNISPQIDGSTTHCIVGPNGDSVDTVQFENLQDTVYTISEVGPDRYTNSDFAGTNCVWTGDSVGTATVSPGITPQDAQCTFVNQRSLGDLTVSKDVIGPNGEDVFDDAEMFGFTFDFGSGEQFDLTDEGETSWNGIPTGIYTIVEENIPSGYEFESFSIDEDTSLAGAQVIVHKDQLTTLEVTNKQVGATLHVTKDVVDPLGAPIDDPSVFEISLDGGTSVQIEDGETVTFDPLLPGAHVLEETLLPTGYFLSSFSLDEDPGTAGAQLTLLNDQETFLTITNQQDLSVLTVEKSDNIDPVPVGADFSYTITAQNEGPHTLHDLLLTDQLPSPFELLSVTSSLGSCTPDLNDESLECNVGDLGAGQIVSVTIGAIVPVTALAGTYENVSSITAYEYPEPLTASETTTVTDLFDLSVTKEASVESIVAGDVAGFDLTINVKNEGPSVARDMLLLDSIPSQFVVESVTNDDSETDCSLLGSDLICNIPLLLDQEETVIVVHLTVPYDVDSQSVENVVYVDTDDDQWEASDSVLITEQVDLQVTKDDNVDEVLAGEGFTYLLSVQNSLAALSDADNVVLQDIIPEPFVAIGVDNPNCGLIGNGLTCEWDHLDPGATPELIEVSVEVPPVVETDSYLNIATLASDEDLTGQEANVSTNVIREASLWVEKSDSVDPVTADMSGFSYMVTFGNNGPSSAGGVVLIDHLPEQLEYLGYTVLPGDLDLTCAFGSPSTPPVDTYYAGREALNCEVGAILPGQVGVLKIDVQIAGNLDVDQTVNYVDLLSSEGGHASTEEITEYERRIQLRVTKWDQFAEGEFAVAGADDVVYTIRAWNDGLLTANDLVVRDTLPAEFTFVSADERCTYHEALHMVTCPVDTLPNGVVEEFVIKTTLAKDVDAGAYLNSVEFSGEGELESAQEWTSVAEVSDLQADMRLMSYNVRGKGKSKIKYEVRIKNLGPSDAEGVEVWDDLTGILGDLDQRVLTKTKFRIVTSDGISCDSVDLVNNGVSCYIGDFDVFDEEENEPLVWFKLFIDIPVNLEDGEYENIVDVWSADGSKDTDSVVFDVVGGR